MDRYNSIKKVSFLGILGNVFLLLLKMSIGIFAHSQAMIADAINSADDIFASFMSSIGNRISNKPQDLNHNFGHGKAEYIFSFLIAQSMILVALKSLYDSVISLFTPQKVGYPIFLIIVCIITIVIKFLLFLYANAMNKKYDSLLLEANRNDHRNDCLVTSFTLISIIFNINGIYRFDGIAGVFISLWICYTGISIFIKSWNVLMDSSLDENTKQDILNVVSEFSDIQKVDHFSSISVGYKYLISISIYVDGNMSTYKSHEIANELEKRLNKFEQVYLAIIHVNPC